MTQIQEVYDSEGRSSKELLFDVYKTHIEPPGEQMSLLIESPRC